MIALEILLTGLCVHLYRKTKQDKHTQLLNKAQFNIDCNKLRRTTDIIILIDIDKFKKINDTFGHKKGDKIIESIAKHIRTNIRFSDKAYRIGGDEFAIITNDKTLANRLIFDVPVSVGMGKTYEEADKAMYAEKQSWKKMS
jgi:diguanylate cyclase (GGDEF)-like protein